MLRWSLILPALALAVKGDKLAQGHLPPPGAVTAGGYPGDLSAPLSGHPTVIPIISYFNRPNSGDGSYAYSYETGNGIKANEEGVLKPLSPEGEAESVQGAYSYTAPDGVLYTITYTADENGFVARGDHLPTPPPIPPEIQVALEQNAVEEAYPQSSVPGQISYFKSYPPLHDNRKLFYTPVYSKYYRRK